MPTINDYMKQTIDLRVGPGHTLNDGLLAFFQAGGATATTLSEAEQQWAELKSFLNSDITDELWYSFLTASGYNISGTDTNDDMKYRYWQSLPTP